MSDAAPKKLKLPKGSFFVVPDRVNIYDLPHVQLKLYLALCDFADADLKCFPSYESLAKKAKCSRSTAIANMPVLLEMGLVSVVKKRKPNGDNYSNRYQLNQVPSPATRTTPSPTTAGLGSPTPRTRVVRQDAPGGSPAAAAPELNIYPEENPINKPTYSPTENGVPANEQTDESLLVFDEKPIDKRNSDVQTLIEEFTNKVGVMSRISMQRRAAYTLVQRHGVDRVLAAITMVAEYRGTEFFPSVRGLEDVRDKWLALEEFVLRKRNVHQHSKMGTIA